MSDGPSVKVGTTGVAYPGTGLNTNSQNSISLGEGPSGYTLSRVAFYAEMHVVTYSVDSAPRPLDVNWWPFTFPVIGVWWTPTDPPAEAPEFPISGADGDGWVVWDRLSPYVDFSGVDANGNEQVTVGYKTTAAKTISETRRRAINNTDFPLLTLCWEWLDPLDLINRDPGTFPQAYDLYASWACKSWWFQTPGL